MGEEFRYDIGGKIFVQRPLVLGQIRQLLELLKGVVLPREFGARDLVVLLGANISKALAIILCKPGEDIRTKDLDAMAQELEFSVSAETAIEVIEDFFACSQVASLLRRIEDLAAAVEVQVKGTGSSRPSYSSPEETSPDETRSSGDTPSQSADRT